MPSKKLLLVGCLVAALGSAPASAEAPDPPKWHPDVQEIVYDRCVLCHQPGEIGPFSLTTYKKEQPNPESGYFDDACQPILVN